MRSLSFVLWMLAAAVAAGESPDAHFYVRRANDPALVRPDTVVRWRSLTPEALKEAEQSGKPLFMFLTTDWLKAGKEMERVTFGDLEIASRLNDEFIPIKIDRDAHPDLDFRLQQAVTTVSGMRGWPLCAFLTPDGHVFAGGTFFPADDDAVTEKPGLRAVIYQVVNIWRGSREAAQKAASELTVALGKQETKPALLELSSSILKGVKEGLFADQQTVEGRPAGTVVRFPAPRALLASLLWAERTHSAAAKKRTLELLDGMLAGGIYDCTEQGFFRCSVDGNWRVPRFEKLLIQNAEMMSLLDAAWRLTGDERYQRLFEQTRSFVQKRLKAGSLFANALSGGANDFSEGDYYAWSVAEVEQQIADDATLTFFKKAFEIGERGDLSGTSPFRNVLPNALHRASAEDAGKLESVLEKLRQSQQRRPAPVRSNVVCVDANALYAAALIESETSRAAGLEVLKALLPQAGLHAVNADGKQLSKALLSDEAALALACAAAYEATGDAEFEKAGTACLERLEKDFLDPKDGTFFDRPADRGEFAAVRGRLKIYADTWEPSPMGLVAQAFLKWSALDDKPAYWLLARRCVLGCGEITEGLGHYGATLAVAADWLKNGGVTVTVVSKPNAPEAEALRKAALDIFAPGKAVRRAAMPDVPEAGVSNVAAYAVVERNGKRVLTSDVEALKKAIGAWEKVSSE